MRTLLIEYVMRTHSGPWKVRVCAGAVTLTATAPTPGTLAFPLARCQRGTKCCCGGAASGEHAVGRLMICVC